MPVLAHGVQDVGAVTHQSTNFDGASIIIDRWQTMRRRQYSKLNPTLSEHRKAIRLNPELAVAYSDRGDAYNHKGDYDHAISDYDQAIRLNPNDADAYNNRGGAYYREHVYDRGDVRLQPGDPAQSKIC